jgi:hypothetical protein
MFKKLNWVVVGSLVATPFFPPAIFGVVGAALIGMGAQLKGNDKPEEPVNARPDRPRDPAMTAAIENLFKRKGGDNL